MRADRLTQESPESSTTRVFETRGAQKKSCSYSALSARRNFAARDVRRTSDALHERQKKFGTFAKILRA